MPIKFDGLGRFVNKRTALAAGIIFCLACVGLASWPRRVNFSYADTTCVGELAVLPGTYRAVGSANYKIDYRGGVAAGKLRLASTRICFVPTVIPKAGVVRVDSAPLGGWIFRERYDLAVSAAPRVLDDTPAALPLSQPLALSLSQPDTVFQYYLVAGSKDQRCKTSAAKLLCGVNQLGLTQGATYGVHLQRRFDGRPAGAALGLQLAILPATAVTAASVTEGEIVYTKPKNADITLDKPVRSATATLEEVDGAKTTPVDTRVGVSGTKVQLAWDQDLPREKAFRLTLVSATATDGSTLDGAYSVNFTTSGGPKVVGINIADGDVPADGRVVVTLDQALAPDTNLASLASISGGGASISQQGDNQVVFALHNVPVCGAFTLNLAKGLMGANGIASDAAWSQASRVSCRLTKTIGYSVKGRAMQAYFYGSGTTTVLFVGGIHGNEPSGAYLMQDWANYLDTNAYKIPAGRQVVVVPEANPDGIAADQRYNANNVNLDRNFPTSDWEKDIQVAGGATLLNGGGVTPGDQPETQAMMALIETLHVRAEFSFHAEGSLVGANKIADSTAIGAAYAQAVGYQTVFYDPEQVFGYTLTGELETWEGEQFGMPAVLVELPTLSGHYFSKHVNELWAMVNLQ